MSAREEPGPGPVPGSPEHLRELDEELARMRAEDAHAEAERRERLLARVRRQLVRRDRDVELSEDMEAVLARVVAALGESWLLMDLETLLLEARRAASRDVEDRVFDRLAARPVAS